jgi:hypothetical protein
MGITVFGFGLGAGYPPSSRIAQPLVCPGGTMSYQVTVFRPYPGKTVSRISWICVDASGAKKPIDFITLGVYAGSMYGLMLFPLVAFRLMLGSRRSKAAQAAPTATS